MERFQREARAASALNHPNICTIYDIDEYEGRPFMVMELLEGETLKRRLSQGPLPTDELLDLGIQLADALDVAAQAGHRSPRHQARQHLRHRARPSQNPRFRPGQADAERARRRARRAVGPNADTMAEHLTSPGTALGTVAYMSPEQARGEEVDSRTDIFSLGVVLYEMATGKEAFAGNTSAVVFDAILNRTPPDPPRLNPNLPPGLEPHPQQDAGEERALALRQLLPG